MQIFGVRDSKLESCVATNHAYLFKTFKHKSRITNNGRI